MKFKQQRSPSVPEVNLVPMIDVLMSVLLFFIITSMTLTTQILGSVKIPQGSSDGEINKQTNNQPTLIIGLDTKRTILIDGKPGNEEEMIEKVEQFLDKNPLGEVIIKADETLSYEDISQFLNELSQISSQQVFLAIDTGS